MADNDGQRGGGGKAPPLMQLLKAIPEMERRSVRLYDAVNHQTERFDVYIDAVKKLNETMERIATLLEQQVES